MVLGAVHIGFPQHTEDYLARIWFREEEEARPVDAVARRRSEEGFAPAPLGLALRCKRIESEGRNARQARLVSAEDRLRPPETRLHPGSGPGSALLHLTLL